MTTVFSGGRATCRLHPSRAGLTGGLFEIHEDIFRRISSAVYDLPSLKTTSGQFPMEYFGGKKEREYAFFPSP